MDSNGKIKKIYLDENIKPVIQKNKNGVIIEYNSNEGNVCYELTYHYFMR
jgi:hypothetical protein